jgi:NAD(P)-dependent dehydrogenase (short-subunit alcohol dehydrogenase family)
VAVVDANEPEGQIVIETIIDEGGQGMFLRCDVTRAADCQLAVWQTVEQLGKLDILFNNAGIIRRASVVETSEEEWDLVMATNVKSVFLFSKYAIPIMTEGGGGVIINIASGWGLVGGRNAASYCASKGAVVLLTKAMALDHGAQNIRVNCICPGSTDTPMLRNEAQQLGKSEEQFLAESAQRPLQRVGRPEEIAQAALYLAGDASSFVTGTALVVDGGGLAGSE